MSTPSEAAMAAPTVTSPSNQEIYVLLRQLMEEQRTTTAKQEERFAGLEAKQEQTLNYVESIGSLGAPTDSTSTTADPNDEVKQQAHIVRNSRASVYLNNSNNALLGDNLLSPLAPPVVRARTDEEKERRASYGIPFTSPAPTAKTLSRALPTASDSAPPVDKSHKSKYWEANHSISRMDKFYGDKRSDREMDVYQFVRSVDFQLDRWMEGELFGRLELVISCTGGPAQMWLLSKRDDLNTLVTRGQLAPEMAEWDAVKADFIDRMGGGQAQRLYQSRLDDLKLGRHNGSDDVMKFITTFREYAERAFPLHKYPDTRAKSLMLGKIFQERICASDFSVWREAMRSNPIPETLEEWEVALSSAWTTEHTLREQSKKWRDRGNVQSKGGNSLPQHAAVHHLRAEGETDDETTAADEIETLNAVLPGKDGGTKAGGHKRVQNKHINAKTAALLIRANRCLHCYQSGHYARECKAPANRAPTENELKAKAGQ
jgi:hypothetical protein